MLLQNKVVIISGVGPGLGRTLAQVASSEGAKVVLGARNPDFLEAVASDIQKKGGQVVWRSTDVTDADQCLRLAQAAVEAYGRIDGLVNSAYLHGDWATADRADPAAFASVYDVNCVGALRMAQAILPSMKASGGGSIVNVTTMATVKPFPGEASYAASKGALSALTRHMAQDFGAYGIRVNAARMGWIGGAPVYDHIDRQVAAGLDREAVIKEITDRIALRIIPAEEDCARAILTLLSDQMKVVSGATIDINGGEYMSE